MFTEQPQPHATALADRPEALVSRGVLLAGLTALALVVRLIGLDGGLWYDEIRTLVDSVRSPLSRIVTVFAGDNQHTLYSVLANISVQVFGDHPWSLRLPSALAGAATVPVLYLFAREFARHTEALLAALLLAVSYHHVWFSQSARGYAILTLLAVLSSWLLLRGLRRGAPSDFVWYGVVAALGVYTHVSMVFLVASHALACLLPLGSPFSAAGLVRWRMPLIGFVVAGLCSSLLYAPVLLEVRHSVAKAANPMRGATPAWAVRELLRGLEIGWGGAIGALAGIGLLGLGLWNYLRKNRFVLVVFLLPGILTIAAAVALQRPVRPRFFVFLIGFALLIIVRGAIEAGRLLWRRGAPGAGFRLGAVLVIGMAVASATTLPKLYRYPKQDFEGAMRFVDASRLAGDVVATAGPASYPYLEYFRRDWPAVTSAAEVRRLREGGREVWVLYTLESYIQSDSPELMQLLRSECAVARVFPGTVAGGELTVCRFPPGVP